MTPSNDADRVIASCHDYIPVYLNDEMIASFKTIEIDSPYMHTTGVPGRLLVFGECNFLNAVCNMSQTTPTDIDIAMRYAGIFTLHECELRFLQLCKKHRLYLNKYMICYHAS